ncbi:hypothetical protein, partial [Lonsdalea britannica]|uniref:hypothetical protein n=1 Tax=Lonsdalea britannica TaxID=1082704 RepID=UPI0026F209C8
KGVNVDASGRQIAVKTAKHLHKANDCSRPKSVISLFAYDRKVGMTVSFSTLPKRRLFIERK